MEHFLMCLGMGGQLRVALLAGAVAIVSNQSTEYRISIQQI
jgi:hypothetical protein